MKKKWMNVLFISSLLVAGCTDTAKTEEARVELAQSTSEIRDTEEVQDTKEVQEEQITEDTDTAYDRSQEYDAIALKNGQKIVGGTYTAENDDESAIEA